VGAGTSGIETVGEAVGEAVGAGRGAGDGGGAGGGAGTPGIERQVLIPSCTSPPPWPHPPLSAAPHTSPPAAPLSCSGS